MTRRLSFFVIVVSSCLLALATSASAECAWVLWSQTHDPKAGAWVLQTAYPSVSDCTKAIDRREKEGKKAEYVREDGRKIKGVTDRRAETDLFVLYGRDASNGGMAWQCFPETVDPRGPKGR
jgi:hypothetical protein